MKSVLFQVFVVLASLATPLHSAVAADPGVYPKDVLVATRLGLAKHATALFDRAVVIEQGGYAGDIADILVDFQRSEIIGIVLMPTNGVAVLIPCSAFTCVRDDRIAVDAVTPVSKEFPHAVRARKCVGRDLMSSSGEMVGRVENLVLDVRAGRMVYVITDRPAEKGKVDTRLVPPSVVSWRSGDQPLLLNATASDYLAGPTLHRKFPVEMFNGSIAREVYAHYGLASQVNVAGGERSDPRDLRLTREILASLPRTGRSQRAEVMAITQNGCVVLEGVVDSAEQERDIVAAAERLAGAGNVRNELRLAQKSGASR